mgnify:CR=1 FL=1|tara:strand:- start:134 stop:430 length:297 start_codon:yes stop_codon:yes gene_type:complete
MIYEYELDGSNIPSWIEDGGYFINPANSKLIGYSTSSSVPSGTTTLTKAQLITRVLNIHATNKWKKLDARDLVNFNEVEMTNDEVTAIVESWASARGL